MKALGLLIGRLGTRVALSWGVGIGYVAVVLLVIVAFVGLAMLLPALFVWSVNELLEQAGTTYQIAWGFWTWLSSFVLIAFFASRG